MGINLPFGRRRALEWLEGRLDRWSDDPAGIGLSSAQVADLAQAIGQTRDDLTAAHEFRAHAQAKTLQFHTSADALHTRAANLITLIKGFAATSPSATAVYAAAGLSPRGAPSPVEAPLRPTSLGIRLENSGNIVVTWEGGGPTGTLYEVYRKLPGETDFVLKANVDAQTKAYVDNTLPVGTTYATYMIRGVRGKKKGPYSTQFNVQFGPTVPQATQEKTAA